MIQSYKMIFSLGVFHTYFENGICTCLHFSPASSSSALLKRFGFKMRQQVNGFDLFCNTTGNIPSLFSYMTSAGGQDYFEFTMTSSNRAFPLFTDLPSGGPGQLIFDSGSASNQFVNGAVLLAGSTLSMPVVTETGSLKIYFSDIMKFQDAAGSTAFEIRFKALATQWQYYIVNKSAAQLDNPSISGKPGVSFEGPENVTIPSGQQAMLFSSGTNLLPLSEVPKYKFDLVNNPATGNPSPAKKIPGGKIIFKGLPNPDPGNTGFIMLNGKKQSSSPIYVYV